MSSYSFFAVAVSTGMLWGIGRRSQCKHASSPLQEKVWKWGWEVRPPLPVPSHWELLLHRDLNRLGGTVVWAWLSQITLQCCCVFPWHGPGLFHFLGYPSNLTLVLHPCCPQQEPARVSAVRAGYGGPDRRCSSVEHRLWWSICKIQ